MAQTTQQEEWLVTDGMGEYVRYYHPTGDVMVFTHCREEAMRTSDSRDAFKVARLARTLYRRVGMRMGMA